MHDRRQVGVVEVEGVAQGAVDERSARGRQAGSRVECRGRSVPAPTGHRFCNGLDRRVADRGQRNPDEVDQSILDVSRQLAGQAGGRHFGGEPPQANGGGLSHRPRRRA